MVQGWETLFKVGKHGLSVVNMAQGWFVLLKVNSWFKVGYHGSRLGNMAQDWVT